MVILALVMDAGYENAFKKISIEIGGAKRLYAIVSTVSTVVLTPLALLTYFFSTVSGVFCIIRVVVEIW